ncbi:MAG: tyrosine--tRNA ligase, partial [Planctomycetes bacterium]|nr:tyrosine--tRNA ligase [Planctomycetota bacterium]
SRTSGKPLRVKLGLDPSRPDIHIGHTVVLRKLRQFQDLGHHPVLIIGNATAMIGDPTGRSKTRPALTEEEVEAAAQTYFDQVRVVLDASTLEVVRNGDWFAKMGFGDVMRLAAKTTVARMLERDDFEKRFKAQQSISLHEFFYPLMQGYDSVVVEADVELGGTDQTFNLLMGRKLQEESGQAPQVCMTMPLLTGLDGSEKMSKSLANTIDVLDSPDDMYGKTMSIPDAAMATWFSLLAQIPSKEVKALVENDPRAAKDRLAKVIVATFHGEEAANAASEEFVRRFKQAGIPDDIPTHSPSAAGINAIDLLHEAGLAESKSEARRLIKGGGVRLIRDEADPKGEVISDGEAALELQTGFVVKVGKRRFVRIG